jgi:transcriptional regulator with XRE-family HTH domain
MDTNTTEALGLRIKDLREQLRLSQEELAERSGLSQNHISQVERGTRGLSRKSLPKVASTLETSVAYLLGETNDPKRYTTLLGEQEGATGNPPSVKSASTEKREVIDLKNSWEAELVKVPVYDIRTCAGYGTSHFFEDVEIIGERLLPVYRVGTISVFDDRKPFITAVDGDSMSAAKIYNGDEIVVNPAEDIHSGDAALVCFGPHRDTAVKWVYFLPSGDIELRSATPGFPNLKFTKEQQESEESPVTIIGRVMSYTGVPKRG